MNVGASPLGSARAGAQHREEVRTRQGHENRANHERTLVNQGEAVNQRDAKQVSVKQMGATPVTTKPAGVKPVGGRPAGLGGIHFLYGLHAVSEALQNPSRLCQKLSATVSALDVLAPALERRVREGMPSLRIEKSDRGTLDRLVPHAVHQGVILECAPLPEIDLESFLRQTPLPRILLLLDQVTDPQNVGAIVRSAAAFGASGVVVTERHAPGETAALAKTASGGLEHVPLFRVANFAQAIDTVKGAGYWAIGLAEEGARFLPEIDLTGPIALVLGAEGEGLRRRSRERCHELARLPTSGPIGALNVSNAAAVALYEVSRRKA